MEVLQASLSAPVNKGIHLFLPSALPVNTENEWILDSGPML